MGEKLLAKKLEEFRTANGYTKKTVAEGAGLTYGAYCGYEYGRRDPDSESIAKLAAFYNCSVDELMGIEKKEDPTQAIPGEVIYQFLIDCGFVKDGEDLSDGDLRFLTSIFDVIAEWFAEKNA